MRISVFAEVSAAVCCFVLSAFVLSAPVAMAQTSVQLFSAVDVRASESTASYQSPDTFNTTTLSLTCSASPIVATLSGPEMNATNTAPVTTTSGALQSGGNLLVDNNIIVTVTPQGGSPTSTNVCTGYKVGSTYDGQPVPPLYAENCFQSKGYSQYTSLAPSGLIGDDPDTFVTPSGGTIAAIGGVAPIDISGELSAGRQSVTIALADEGVWLANSTLFLTTNCMQDGVTGPAVVSGSTITPVAPGQPPTPEQTQDFSFNTNQNQMIGFVYDLSKAQIAGTLTTNSEGVTPIVSDLPINPGTFQSNLANGTSFATSSCLIHSGELGGPVNEPATQQACKLYTLECTTGTGSAASGAQCPVSTLENEVMEDTFDGPAFTLPDIPTVVNGIAGPTFHEGIGLLMASEGWGSETGVPPGTWNWDAGTGGQCIFDPISGLQNLPCPQNLLISFSGPGTYSSEGQTSHPNSTFISVYGVPEDLTSVTVTNASGMPTPLKSGNWTNNPDVYVVLSSQPPNVRNASPALPNAANFVAAPIQSITYGVTPAASLPVPINEPISTDTVVPNTAACPVPPATGTASVFSSGVQSLDLGQGDGNYLLHYYAEDCAGTQELQFTNTASNGSGIWSTSFYTFPINLDTVSPTVTSPALSASGPYLVGQPVTASYSCTDDRSGVVNCGGQAFPVGTLSTGPLITAVPTTTAGNKTLTVTATDAAGNQSSQSVSYTVLVAPTVVLTTSSALTLSGSSYHASVTVTNTGTAAAYNVKLTAARLGAASLTSFPAGVTISPNSSATFSLTFPSSAGAAGAGVPESYSGTYALTSSPTAASGTFSYSARSATLP